jgi:hypothetical protein
MWSIVSELEPARKAAAVIMRLQGSARELARNLPPQTIIAGGLVNGVPVDPMTYLMHALAERYALLGEEASMQAVSELMNFDSQPNERVDELLIRFDNARQRAMEYGQLNINIQGMTWILLKAMHITDNQLVQLLQPLDGRFPANNAEFDNLRLRLRRLGHIVEHHPGNIASTLRTRHNPQQAFFGQQPQQDNAAYQPTIPSPSAAWLSANTPATSDMPDDAGFDSGTDSDTISSDGNTDYSHLVPEGTPESPNSCNVVLGISTT